MKTILNTRPKAQAAALSRAIKAIGCEALEYPVTEIESINHTEIPVSNWQYDFLIFTSSNAVKHAKPFLPKQQTLTAKIAAIGSATADALTAIDYSADIIPNTFNSEGLLESLSQYTLTNQKVLIITGVGGRGLLEEQLKKQQASVDRLEIYRRIKPNAQLAKALLEKTDMAILTSAEGLQNFYEMTPQGLRSLLFNIKLLVISSRMLAMAEQLGFNTILLASDASTEAIVQTIKEEINDTRST